MKLVNWWFVAGCVVTVAVAAALSDLWNLSGLAAVGAGWGVLIGTDIREKRKVLADEGAPNESSPPTSRWVDAMLAVAVGCGLLGIGSAVGVAGAALTSNRDDLFAPTISGVVLVSVSVTLLLLLLMRARRASRQHGDV